MGRDASRHERHDKPRPDPINEASAVSAQLSRGSRLSSKSKSRLKAGEAGRAQSQSQWEVAAAGSSPGHRDDARDQGWI